jgi:hypothetical protein
MSHSERPAAQSAAIATATPIARGTGMLPLCSDAVCCWCVVDHWFYRLDYATGALTRTFRLPRQGTGALACLKDLLARSWIRRTFRPGKPICTMVMLRNGDLVTIFDRVYVHLAASRSKFAEVIAGDASSPIEPPLNGGAAVHGVSQHVYFGEYLNNHSRDIRVARIDVANRRLESCWSFSRQEIKHVHAIHYDQFRDRLWICTGDQDHESAFYYTDDEFKSVHRFAGGDQSWRAIAVLFDRDGMEWGMDAGKDAPADAVNHIYRYVFATGERTHRATIGNPVYSACELDDGTAVMQTTFEPGRRQDTPEESALWWRNAEGVWTKCFSSGYAEHPEHNNGKYGAIMLPRGLAPSTFLPFMPVNGVRGSNSMHRLNTRGIQK